MAALPWLLYQTGAVLDPEECAELRVNTGTISVQTIEIVLAVSPRVVQREDLHGPQSLAIDQQGSQLRVAG